MTVETNIKVFSKKDQLYIWVREANIVGAHISAEIAEKACLKLVFNKKLPAIVFPNNCTKLLIATRDPVETVTLESKDWKVTVVDAGKAAHEVRLSDKKGTEIVPALLERALIRQLLLTTDLWTLDSSRIWHESKPFDEAEGIQAYCRYRIGTLSLEDEGPGVIADVETAFFTTKSLAYYLDGSVEEEEQKHRRDEMERLMKRQEKQKGTLLYDFGRDMMKCYFVDAPGLKCNQTPEIRIDGKDYKNLAVYYKETNPNLEFDEEGEAVRVSFQNKGTPVYVAAELLRIRVMNDNVPDELKLADKIRPSLRRSLLIDFWSMLGPNPFGNVAPKPCLGFWRPSLERLFQFALPNLKFGQDTILTTPEEFSIEAYRENYKYRIEYLEEVGCWYVPPNMQRKLYFVYPQTFNQNAVSKLASDMTEKLRRWTGCKIECVEPIPYHSILDVASKLTQRARFGIVVFILDSDPGSYYEAAFQLDKWRIKRVTQYQLQKHYDYLTNGMWDRRQQRMSKRKGKSRWHDFVNFNALDTLQLLGAFPFVPDHLGEYEAQLFIDVGHERQDFILSLLIARDESKNPAFRLVSRPIPKNDPQHDSINPRVLSDEIEKLFLTCLKPNHDPLTSLLVERDGRFCGDEETGVDDGLNKAKSKGQLVQNGNIDFINLRKSSQNPVRLWNVESDESVTNPLEGTAIRLNSKTVLIAATGAATLSPHGTTRPYIVVGNGRCPDILRAARITFNSTQINWSSPQKAQRLPLHVKNADEELQSRAAQRIRRYK